MLNALALQDFLFEKKTNRIDLLNYSAKTKSSHFRVLVYRNHSFELIENTMRAYLDFSGINVKFEYSDYDDSLSFSNINSDIDLIIVWVDISRYKEKNLSEFFNSRLQYLKSIFKKPIIFSLVSDAIKINETGVFNTDFSSIEKELGDKFFDTRMSEYTGTNLSNQACLMISKEFGLKYLPALLIPGLKAIALDLDNTLYKGVLGEDGYKGIELTEGHLELQKTLKKLVGEGYFVCVVSKNNIKDVEELFNKRNDFILNLDDFTQVYASWDEKNSLIEKMAKDLNINHDSILFIDDNIGEISSVLEQLPNIKFVLAKENAHVTNEILKNYPGLLKTTVTLEDHARVKDMQENLNRANAQATMSKEDYLNSLNVELTYSINNSTHIDRISELANKTNQFIFSYKRYSKTQVEDLVANKDYCVISISLKDKLSNSGIIGVLVGRKDSDAVILEELFVSCRSLGRGLDEIMIFGAIEILLNRLVCDKLKVNFSQGERNEPAYKFVQKNLQRYLNNCSKYKLYPKDSRINIKEIVDGN